jgi:hypothetical protein
LGANLAYLTDRVLVAQKKPQRYGTQARPEGGKMVPFPIEDEAKVDERRAELGLAPLADYLKQMESFYAPKQPPAPPPPPAPAVPKSDPPPPSARGLRPVLAPSSHDRPMASGALLYCGNPEETSHEEGRQEVAPDPREPAPDHPG